MKINGIPHGDEVFLEIYSGMFSFIERHALKTVNVTDQLFLKMNVIYRDDYFASVNLCVRLSRVYYVDPLGFAIGE